MINLTFWGAARQVTGSMHLLEANGARLLLDCGMVQGHRAEANEQNAHLPFDAAAIDYVLLSHAHLDHCGNLPSLVKGGYRGEIICTHATNDLARLILRDAGKIQEQDAEFLTRQHVKRGQPPIVPLYTLADVENTIKLLSSRSYDYPFELTRAGTRATFYDAGHILGSAVTTLELSDGARTVRVGYSGDLGIKNKLILRDPHPAPRLDYLILEGTYGDRVHPPPQQSEKLLAEIVQRTTRRGGKTIIPAFAVDRTQDIVYSLHRSILSGAIDPVPVFVDSPMAIDATDIYRMNPEVFDDETCAFMEKHEDPWGFRQLTYTRDVLASKAINEVTGPAVIISSNGMVEAGRILHHVKNNIGDPRNTILFVGYQAQNTLGRRIKDGAKQVRIFGDEYTVRAQIASAEGFSAHADHDGLLNWVEPIANNLKQVFVVHAEQDAAATLVQGLKQLGIGNAYAPERGERFELA